jgi:hypothetical protein
VWASSRLRCSHETSRKRLRATRDERAFALGAFCGLLTIAAFDVVIVGAAFIRPQSKLAAAEAVAASDR